MQRHPAHVELARRLASRLSPAGNAAKIEPPREGQVRELSADRYTSEARFSRERARIFSRTPALLFHESELPSVGSCMTTDVAGIPLLVMRGEDGAIRAFKNACRHRATRLLDVVPSEPCRKKAIVCPYHGWTYDLRGALVHVPHEASFGGRAAERAGLQEVHTESRHGFVWASLEGDGALARVGAHLGGLDEEIGALGLSDWSIYQRSTRDVAGNWKLIVDAFLDGYHIRHLHRDTIYRFFIDAASEADKIGVHVRGATARRTLREVDAAALDQIDLAQVVTVNYTLFPDVILVLHPDYLSVMRVMPLSADRTRFTHAMLVPRAPRSAEEDAHWQKSFTLIDEGVFTREDLATVEAIQRGLAARADETVLFGALEESAIWFHDAVDAALA